MEIFRKLMEFLDGKKTYIFCLLLMVFGFLDFKDMLTPFLEENKMEIYITLATGAGISLRMGMDSANRKMVQMLSKKHEDDKES